MGRQAVVIYTRFSSDLQRTESCADQEREIRKALTRRSIALHDVEVIRDEAESGTRTDRDGFQQLARMIAAKEIGILAVDDQSRLSRADNAYGFIKDLVYSGGRFISTSENIDTADTGWELKVKVMQLHHGESLRNTRERVRRGQLGRVLADDSVGDFPYGYESFYHDPNWQEMLAGRGPRPKKGIRIYDVEAEWVRQIFRWFLDDWSINAISRELTANEVSKGRRTSKPGWHPQHVHRILTNSKYIGRWVWGATTVIQNSTGKKKQIPVDPNDVVVRERPELAIISQEIWDQAQARLEQLREQFGVKPGQAKRGPKAPTNTSDAYPRSILGPVLRCAACGSRMWYSASNQRRYYKCSGYIHGRCTHSFQVRASDAERAVIERVTQLLSGWPEWMNSLTQRVRELVLKAAEQLPAEQAKLERELAVLLKQRGHVTDAIKHGGSIPVLVEQLHELEWQLATRDSRLAQIRVPIASDIELPSREWVEQQLATWIESLADPQRVAIALSEAIECIEARPVLAPGKKHGYVELTIQFGQWELFRAAVGNAWPLAIRNVVPATMDSSETGTEVIAVGEPTPMDRWAAQIVEWREQGVKWKDIVVRTGMDLNRVYRAWKRYQDAKKSEEDRAE
jgi:site-specific DNA recombinase